MPQAISTWILIGILFIPGGLAFAEQSCEPGEVAASVRLEGGVAIDRRSGLMWMRCAYGQRWSAGHCQRQAETFTWREARVEIARFNEQGGAFGFTDWRLPTVEEMLSIVVPGCDEPALDLRIFPDAPITAYWTRTPDPVYPPGVMLVHFVNGRAYMGNRSVAWSMRLVREP